MIEGKIRKCTFITFKIDSNLFLDLITMTDFLNFIIYNEMSKVVDGHTTMSRVSEDALFCRER